MRARAAGWESRYLAPPNPWVGCVVLQGSEVVGVGATQAPGGNHAEVEALTQAGAQADGATAIVTLEPCAHHGRTGPCADVLIASGIHRVIYVLPDPDPLVAGAGHAALTAAGINVYCLASEVARMQPTDRMALTMVEGVREDLASYLWHREHARPYVTAKLAITRDGFISVQGESTEITSADARSDGHLLRAASQAIIVGSETAAIDRPQLTVRGGTLPSVRPIRIVLDSQGKTPVSGPLANAELAPTLIGTTEQSSSDWRAAWESVGAEVLVLPAKQDRLELPVLLDLLGQRGILSVLVEGGGKLVSSFLHEQLVQTLVIYVAPTTLGAGTPAFLPSELKRGISGSPLRLESVRTVGEDVRLEFRA